MKQLGSLVPIILLLGVGITSGLAVAELTASQQVLPQVAAVGETATVTLTLTYNGGNATQIMVVPSLPPGIVTDMPGAQTAALYPGNPVPISYPVRAEQSGSYLITSLISYTEERATRRLNMVSEFTATGASAPSTPSDQKMPVPAMPSMQDQQAPLDTPMPSQGMPSNSMPITPTSTPTPDVTPAVPSDVTPAVPPSASPQSDNSHSTPV
jgi:uncharacterized protein (DUF58 family)